MSNLPTANFDMSENHVNISDISCWSVLLVEESGVPGENHRSASSKLKKLYYIMLYRVHLT
jgi:hypothetical protein